MYSSKTKFTLQLEWLFNGKITTFEKEMDSSMLSDELLNLIKDINYNNKVREHFMDLMNIFREQINSSITHVETKIPTEARLNIIVGKETIKVEEDATKESIESALYNSKGAIDSQVITNLQDSRKLIDYFKQEHISIRVFIPRASKPNLYFDLRVPDSKITEEDLRNLFTHNRVFIGNYLKNCEQWLINGCMPENIIEIVDTNEPVIEVTYKGHIIENIEQYRILKDRDLISELPFEDDEYDVTVTNPFKDEVKEDTKAKDDMFTASKMQSIANEIAYEKIQKDIKEAAEHGEFYIQVKTSNAIIDKLKEVGFEVIKNNETTTISWA